MGNSVSSPGGKVAIACGAAALAWGASYLRDFVSNDEDLSSKSTKKSPASASSTRDVPASDRNELAEEALTDPQNSYGYANGSEASSTRDAPASDRNELAEEALTYPQHSYGYANGSEVLSINSTEVLSFISTKQSSASASSTRDAPASDWNKLAEEVLTDLLNSYGYANGSEVLSINSTEVLSFGCTKQSSASASSTRDAPASDRNKLAEEASVTRRSETPRRISGDPMPRVITIVTYNIWQVNVKLNERMEAIGVLMQEKMPDIILFQEVTPKIHKIFKEFEWWRRYHYQCVSHKTPTTKHYCMLLSRVPVKVLCLKRFKDSIMKEKLIVAEVEAFGKRRRLVVANSHLKKPDLPDESHTKKRTAQAKEAITILTNYENVIFGGDMNWSEELDGRFPLPNGWVDAWKHLKPRKKGWTYDTVSNLMIKGRSRLRRRLDRFLCRLKDYKLAYIEIIGKDKIPGLMHQHKEKHYPVLCSDHFGLLLGISI